jgi:hypothetical protein
MATKSYRSYLSFTAPDEMIAQVAEAIKTQGVKEANKGNVAKLEICKKSYREDIVIGDLYVVPASVCKNAKDFPIALLASGAFKKLNAEEAVEARLQFLASEDMSKETLKLAKEMLFTNDQGEVSDLVVFHPAWANIADVKVIHLNPETLFLDLRDKVFTALYNPTLSNSFEQIKALTGAYRVESIPLQQHVFKTPSYGTAYPEFAKGSEIEATETKVKLGDPDAAGKSVGKDAVKALNIKTTFRLIASSVVPAETKRKKIRLSAAHINELEESILEPEELELFNRVEDVLDNKNIKASSETGLRNREDYGSPDSKENVSSADVDGPDPKKATQDVDQDARMVLKKIRIDLRKMEDSGEESEPAKYDKLFNDYLKLENFVRTNGKDGSGEVQQIIQDHMQNMPDASKEIQDVKDLPAKVEADQVVVEMPKEEFVKEHEKLVKTLEEGTDSEQFEEGEKQDEELKEVEAAASGSSAYRVDTWFERGEGQVTLYKGDEEIASWSGEELVELVEDGYLSPKDWLKSAIEYAEMHGLLKEASQEEILTEQLPMNADDWFQYEKLEDSEQLNPVPVTASSDSKWSVKWSEFNAKDQVVNKTREFATEKARTKFTKQLQDHANFKRFEAWADPTPEKKEAYGEKIEPKLAFTLMVPGQVLEGFYPELAEQLEIQPMGREYNHSPSPEMLQRSLDQQDSGDETKGPAGVGLGPNEPQGQAAPLRKELSLRGPGFTNTFYTPHDDLDPSSLMMASKKGSKTASVENKAKLADVLKKICGQVAASLVAGFQLTSRPLFTDVPQEWTLDLASLESGIQSISAGIMPVQQTGFGFKALGADLNDSDMVEALNTAWAQAAVWNDEGDTGFTYEVFVRAEKLDLEALTLKLKYVIKKKD